MIIIIIIISRSSSSVVVQCSFLRDPTLDLRLGQIILSLFGTCPVLLPQVSIRLSICLKPEWTRSLLFSRSLGVIITAGRQCEIQCSNNVSNKLKEKLPLKHRAAATVDFCVWVCAG